MAAHRKTIVRLPWLVSSAGLFFQIGPDSVVNLSFIYCAFHQCSDSVAVLLRCLANTTFFIPFFQESKLSPARVSVFLAGLRTANSRVLVLHYAGSGHRGLQVNALNLLLADDLCIYFVRP